MDKKEEAVVAGFSLIGLIVFATLLLVLVSLFRAYIVLDISVLFSIPFLSHFTLPQMIALNLIAGLITYRQSKSEDGKFLKPLFTMILGFLIAWGMAYLIFWII